MLRYVIALTFFTLVGCAHSTMRGGVAMKVSEHQAHVCLGDGEVKAGDKVTAFYNDCQNRNLGDQRGSTPCVKKKLGAGKIIEVLNAHYSLVEFDEEVKFTEGTFVEKQN